MHIYDLFKVLRISGLILRLQKPCIFMLPELAPGEQEHNADKFSSWRSLHRASCDLMTVVN